MEEICIVCLGELGQSINSLPALSTDYDEPEAQDSVQTLHSLNGVAAKLHLDHPQQAKVIAHLLPCGHNLHDDCLRPWVERANSCPICRQNFNEVEISIQIGSKGLTRLIGRLLTDGVGPVISSYSVHDRTQVADIDESVLTEDYDALDSQLCPVCELNDNEEGTIECDGCDGCYHTCCVGLEGLPVGPWFCNHCTTDRVIGSGLEQTRTDRHNLRTRRARGQQRQVTNHNQAASSGWSRVWQSVWDRLNLDLDFPLDNVSSSSLLQREHHRGANQQNEFREWERRLRVAERQGGAHQFRNTAATLLNHKLSPPLRPRPDSPEPESVEETLAWNALEKARDIEPDPVCRSKKRKSASTSPSETNQLPYCKKRKSTASPPSGSAPTPSPERKLKRPQTRRPHNLSDVVSEPKSESSRNTQQATVLTTCNRDMLSIPLPDRGPSFLQSLLTEVESSARPEGRDKNIYSGLSDPDTTLPDHSTTKLSSPARSPAASNHCSPRAISITPPPLHSALSGSSAPLSSKVEPLYSAIAHSSEHSSPLESQLSQYSLQWIEQKGPGRQMPHRELLPLVDCSLVHSLGCPSSRASLSLSAKSDVQSMVKDALRFPYNNKQLNRDQYTEINRKISHLLYEKVGDSENLDGEGREHWKSFAREEVVKAMRSLRSEP